jgi:DNA-binding NarL/FixJ family response regulator
VNLCLKEALGNLASVRVLIVDGSQEWRRAVASTLQQNPNLVVIGESSDGIEAIQKSGELQPDLILLDVRLPNLSGLDAARRIRKVAPVSKILFLSSYADPEFLLEAVRIGALGFVVKSAAANELLSAVSAVMRGERFISGRFSAIDLT